MDNFNDKNNGASSSFNAHVLSYTNPILQSLSPADLTTTLSSMTLPASDSPLLVTPPSVKPDHFTTIASSGEDVHQQWPSSFVM